MGGISGWQDHFNADRIVFGGLQKPDQSPWLQKQKMVPVKGNAGDPGSPKGQSIPESCRFHPIHQALHYREAALSPTLIPLGLSTSARAFSLPHLWPQELCSFLLPRLAEHNGVLGQDLHAQWQPPHHLDYPLYSPVLIVCLDNT